MTPPLEQTAARGTGIMLVKDYRGKNGKQEIWKFRANLAARILQTLELAAIEEGQKTENRQLSRGVGISEIRRGVNAGDGRAGEDGGGRESRVGRRSSRRDSAPTRSADQRNHATAERGAASTRGGKAGGGRESWA